MTSILAQLKSKNFLPIILLLQLTLYTTTILNVPIARQIVGFVYFTLVPGFVVTKLLKLDSLDYVETLFFSIGISIALLMLIGLIVNDFGPWLGLSQPLSLYPLLITLSGFTLILAIVAFIRNPDFTFQIKEFSALLHGLLFISLPILSIIGAMWVTVYGGNVVLLFTILAIAIVFTAVAILKKLIPPKLYPIIIFMIAISLLYHSSIVSNNIVSFGSDVPTEILASQITANNAHWALPTSLAGASAFSRVYGMLSVTILPTIYTSILNIDPTLVFKLIYPLIFAFVPVALYKLWQMYISKKYALIATFLFVAQGTFYNEMIGLNRQIIAELFFVLLFLVVLTKKFTPKNKIVCFILFTFALVTSHYAVAEIFIFFAIAAFIGLFLLKKPSRNITLGMISIFFVIMLVWYIYTAGGSVFTSILEFGDSIYRQLGDLFNLGSRESYVLRGLGLEAAPTIWNTISRVFAYLTQILIIIGFVGVLIKRTKARFGSEFFILGLIAIGTLAALIVVPGLANTLKMTRFYHILLFFIAPFFILGIVAVFRLVSKREKKLLVAIMSVIVLVPYFLFQIGFIYEFTGTESFSVPLSMHRMDGLKLYGQLGYISNKDVQSAQWLLANVNYQQFPISADLASLSNILPAYAMLLPTYGNLISNSTELGDIGIIYLNELNTIDGVVLGASLWNSTEFSPILDNMSKIYSNGANEIYLNNLR